MSQTLHIGLLGLGTVGSGIPLILSLNKEKIEGTTGTSFIIDKAFVRNIESKKNIANQYNITLTTELKEIIEDENIEIVVEAMGGVTFAKKAIEDALKNKKHVVTANKDLIAQYGDELTQLAQKNGVYLYYEAAVAGGIPILRTLTNSFSSDDIQLIQGIVNGTTNFMLTQMNQKNWSYEEALLEAQKLGFAESDPTNDVEGIDAAYKMIILTKLAYGMTLTLEDLEIKGISQISANEMMFAKDLGYTIKLIGSAEKRRGKVNVEVSPVLLPMKHPLALIENELNGVLITSTGIGETLLTGAGAGAKPTATSIVSDLVTISKNITQNREVTRFSHYQVAKNLANTSDLLSNYLLVIECNDTEENQRMILEAISSEGIVMEELKREIDEDKLMIGGIINNISKESLQRLEDLLLTKNIRSISHIKAL